MYQASWTMNDNAAFQLWMERRNADVQQAFQNKQSQKKRDIMLKFQNRFCLPCSVLTNLEELTHSSADDGISQYVDLSFLNVYSYDHDEEVWLDVNTHKQEFVKQNKFTGREELILQDEDDDEDENDVSGWIPLSPN